MKYVCYFDVNSHDRDIFGNIRASSVIRYMQEAADLQLHNTGFSYDEMYRQGKAFILSRLNVSIYADLKPHDTLRAETWLSDSHGATFNRLYKLYRGDDLAAEGAAVWGLISIADRRICRVSETDCEIHADTDTVGIDLPKRLSHKDGILHGLRYKRTYEQHRIRGYAAVVFSGIQIRKKLPRRIAQHLLHIGSGMRGRTQNIYRRR